MVRRLVSALVVAFLAVGGALVSATPAAAVLPDGPSSLWSVRTSSPSLPSCASVSGSSVSVGGWDRRRFISSGNFLTPAPAGGVEPISVVLSEPCINATGGLAIVLQVAASTLTKDADQHWARLDVNLDGIQCVNSTGGEFARASFFSGRSAQSSTASTLTPTSELGMGNLAGTNWATNCARLVYLEGIVTLYTSTGNRSDIEVRWSAASWLGNFEYDNGGSPDLLEFCLQPGNVGNILCNGIVDPDPTAWETTCGDSANNGNYGFDFVQFNPVDPSTYGPATAWLAACLFIPLTEFGGFDRNGVLATAWAESPNAEVGQQVVEISEAFTYSPSCGVLFSTGGDGPLPGLTIDTCTWGWAEPVRHILAVGILLLGLLWFIQFIADTAWSLMRNAPASPLKEASK